MMPERALIMQSANGVGDTLTISPPVDRMVEIEIDEPWSGCTETGFGTLCRWELSVDTLPVVIRYLTECLAEIEAENAQNVQ